MPETDSALIKCYAQGRNESALAEYWAPAVKQAAWTRRRGEGSVLTRMDVERVQGYSMQQLLGMRATDSDSERERRERVNNGAGGFVDNVVGLVRGVSEAGQDWRMTMGWVLTVSFAVWFELTLYSSCSGRQWTFLEILEAFDCSRTAD